MMIHLYSVVYLGSVSRDDAWIHLYLWHLGWQWAGIFSCSAWFNGEFNAEPFPHRTRSL